MPQGRVGLERSAIGSCRRERHALKGRRLTILESIGKHAKRQRLRLSLRPLYRICVDEHARQFVDLGNPPAVFLAFDLYLELPGRQNTALAPASLTAWR